jgi:hypothetical protein
MKLLYLMIQVRVPVGSRPGGLAEPSGFSADILAGEAPICKGVTADGPLPLKLISLGVVFST